MSATDPAYVIFDGDKDMWAYAYMKGWKASERVDFDFRDAHDLDSMTSLAQGEDYVKRHLRARMQKSTCVIVLIGESTKNLHKFVRWELELAQTLDLPIIAVNLNNSTSQDARCPPIIRDACVIHVPFKMKVIKYALDTWPVAFGNFSIVTRREGARHYTAETYKQIGI